MSVKGNGRLNWPPGPLGMRAKDVLPDRRALLGLIRVRFALSFDVDRRAVVGGADTARQKGAVVAGVVPGESSLVVAFQIDALDTQAGLLRKLVQ